ncbi:MAG: hypothetical protein B6D39_10550 [Anaerolineae bacterium UTCFX2]|nr:hypothetical protein [Anaerolineales bacterium]OQY88878.1 MAG: hypothetical protein B6D39_10550 [Anaerolineae bacterium UTCFX2]
MAKAEINAGICGFKTIVTATTNGSMVDLTIESECKAIQELAKHLTRVDPLQEISAQRKLTSILELGAKHCAHAACPVPVGVVKAVEVEAGLALPAEASIKLSKT